MRVCDHRNGHRRRILWHFLFLEGVAVLLAASFRASGGESRGPNLTFSIFLAILLPVAFMCKSRDYFVFLQEHGVYLRGEMGIFM